MQDTSNNNNCSVIALLGNPNSGKTTLFNNLTGSHQYVGNWPGVTVEKKEGICRHGEQSAKIVDLPGVYSLTAYSPDEVVARNFILDGNPDIVVNIVDGSSLERHLYLTLQLLEMGAPVVMVLNMMDVVNARKHKIDIKALEKELNVKVVPMSASRNEGTTELKKIICALDDHGVACPTLKINYGRDVESEIKHLLPAIENSVLGKKYPARWIAVKLLERDSEIVGRFQESEGECAPVLKALAESTLRLEGIYGDEAETLIADARYGFISGLIKDTYSRPYHEAASFTDKLDRVLVNRWAGIPIFIALMFLLFQFVFTASEPLMGGIEQVFEWLGEMASGISPGWLASLISDGIIGGLGAVMVFIPPIFLMFIAIAILEDTGYMARAAFIMDKAMHKLGLHGRSFIPMMLGFGCTIPAVMACRTIDNPRDRITTMLITPFMSCGARLPIYVLFAGAFFSAHQGLVLFSMYLIGIVIAVLFAFIFRKTIQKGESAHFVMELPPYRLPTFKSIFIHTWERGKHFLSRAATVILGAVIIIWVLGSLPWGIEYASQDSVLGIVGSWIAPLLGPAGIGHWAIAVSLITGFVAKEVVVATLGAVLLTGSGLLGDALVAQLGWGPLNAYAFMVFCLLYIPCVATISVIRAESGTWKWAAFTAVYTIAVAWIVSTLIFQIGSLLF
ncbi:MAG: ferrous iron transport protein B [Dehalococcoidales bacterium]|nr:ferrous iron transport protein B [Dehalococcoidales bacterium]MDD5122002.1 ferrous iron transport protein B [Dehalococcoidales bacterium]